MDLVAAHGEQVDSPFLGVDLRLAESLHRVHMEKRGGILGIDALCDLLYGLHRSDLVVGVHDGHQDRVIPDSFFHQVGGYDSILVHGKISHFKALGFQILHRLGDCGVLDHRSDQMAPSSHVCQRTADDGDIVGLCTAGSKHEVSLVDLQDLRQVFLRLRDILLRFHSLVVHAGGIAVLFQVYFVHQLHNFRKAPGRG